MVTAKRWQKGKPSSGFLQGGGILIFLALLLNGFWTPLLIGIGDGLLATAFFRY
jgi:hypothetical protein